MSKTAVAGKVLYRGFLTYGALMWINGIVRAVQLNRAIAKGRAKMADDQARLGQQMQDMGQRWSQPAHEGVVFHDGHYGPAVPADGGFILVAILWIFAGLVLLGILVSHPHFALGLWIALTIVGVFYRAHNKKAVRNA
jgi:hypothetical protein